MSPGSVFMIIFLTMLMMLMLLLRLILMIVMMMFLSAGNCVPTGCLVISMIMFMNIFIFNTYDDDDDD